MSIIAGLSEAARTYLCSLLTIVVSDVDTDEGVELVIACRARRPAFQEAVCGRARHSPGRSCRQQACLSFRLIYTLGVAGGMAHRAIGLGGDNAAAFDSHQR